MSLTKKLCIIASAILFVLCLGIDAWFLYIHLFGPEKVVFNTYEVGLQTSTNGDTRYFIELNYYSNENNNGLEMFEVKYNYFMDENQSSFYSQGLQYVANTASDKINWNFYADSTNTVGSNRVQIQGYPVFKYEEDHWGFYANDENSSQQYNYASSDNYEHLMQSTNALEGDVNFRIQLGNDLYLMKFKREKSEKTNKNYYGKFFGKSDFYLFFEKNYYYKYYSYYDVEFFNQLLYNAVQSITPGTNSAMIFEFGDLFNYYEYDSQKGQYKDTELVETDKIKQEMMSYYAIKVNISADGVQKASDSMFKVVNGSASFNLTGDYSSDDYLDRKSVVRERV